MLTSKRFIPLTVSMTSLASWPDTIFLAASDLPGSDRVIFIMYSWATSNATWYTCNVIFANLLKPLFCMSWRHFTAGVLFVCFLYLKRNIGRSHLLEYFYKAVHGLSQCAVKCVSIVTLADAWKTEWQSTWRTPMWNFVYLTVFNRQKLLFDVFNLVSSVTIFDELTATSVETKRHPKRLMSAACIRNRSSILR